MLLKQMELLREKENPFYFIRFLGILIIVTFHFAPTRYNFIKIFYAGSQMVSLFYILSGFFLTISYFNKINFTLKNFYKKRFFKIYPSYFLSLTICLFFIIKNNELKFIPTLTNFLCLQSLYPNTAYYLNPPGWFISTLFILYLLFPLILLLLKKIKPNKKKFIFLCITIWIIILTIATNLLNNSSFYKAGETISHHLIYYFPLIHISSFLLGISGGYFIINSRYKKINGIYSYLLLFFISFLIIFLIQFEVNIEKIFKIKFPFGGNFYSVLFLALILTTYISSNRLLNLVSNKYFKKLGEISLEIYIFQLPIYIIFKHLFKSYFENFNNLYLFFIYLIILILFSLLINKYHTNLIIKKLKI